MMGDGVWVDDIIYLWKWWMKKEKKKYIVG